MKLKQLLIGLVMAGVALAQNTAIYPGATANNKDVLIGANNSQTTLTGAVLSTDTTINVASTTTFAGSLSATAATAIVIDQEVIRVCGSTGTTFTVCTSGRGFDGTSAVNHNNGATVSGFIVAWHHNQLAAEVIALEANAVHSPSPLTSGQLLKGGGGLLAAVGDLSGDVTTSGSLVTIVGKVNGVSFSASPSTNTVPVVTSSNVVTWEAVPNAALANSSVTVNTTSPLTGGGAVALGGTITIACSTCTPSGGITNGQLVVGTGSGIAGGNLSGDATTSGGQAVTVVKVNGVAYGAGPSTNTVPVVTGANTVTYEAVPNAALANSSVTINTASGSGLSGGGTVSLGGSLSLVLTEAVNSQSGTTYTVANSDCGKIVSFSSGTAVAVTLPQAGSGGNFVSGCTVEFSVRGAGTVTITPTTSTLDGQSSLALTQYQGARVVSDGTNYLSNRGIGTTTSFTPTIYGGNSAGSTLSLAGTSNGSPSSAFLYLQSNGQRSMFGCNGNPDSLVEIRNSTGCAASSPLTGILLHLVGGNGNAVGIQLDAYGNPGVYPAMNFSQANGTVAAPTAVASGSGLGSFTFNGYNGSSYITGGNFDCYASETYTGSHSGTTCRVNTTVNGTTGVVFGMFQFSQDGTFVLRQNTGFSRDSVLGDGHIDAGNGTANDKGATVHAKVFDATTGFQVADAAAKGNKLAGDGTNFISEQQAVIISNSFTFSQQPGGTLTGSSPATVTLTPCPYGVAGSDTGHFVYISGGVGTAEAVQITSGTCTSGATTGTIVFTPANNHSGAWTVTSASGGVQEAVNHSCNGSGNPEVKVPSGTWLVYKPIYVNCSTTVRGTGMFKTVLQAQGAAVGIFDVNGGRFTLEDIGLTATVQQTSGGFGVRLGNVSSVSFARMNRIYCEPMYDCFIAVNSDQWSVTNSVGYNFSHDFAQAADVGSVDADGPWIRGNVMFNYLLASPADACLQSISTGVITFESNACVGNANGQLNYGIYVVNNPSTGILISNNEFETTTIAGIRIDGNYNLETITGNFFALPNDSVTGRYGIRLTDGTSTGSNRGSIVGNVFQGPAAATAYKAISIEGSAFNWIVSGDSFYNVATVINSTTTGSVTIGTLDLNTCGSTPFVGSSTTTFALSAPITFAQLPTAANGSFLMTTDGNGTCTAGASNGISCSRNNGAWTH